MKFNEEGFVRVRHWFLGAVIVMFIAIIYMGVS